MMAVSCRRDVFEDVRICLSKDLREFRACPEVVRHGCRASAIAVPAPAEMNYRHGFHAGNFADVFKHALLARLLLYLTRKETPFRVIDTHAGEGAYDLAADEAERTVEWRDGVGRLADLSGADEETRDLLAPYLDCVGAFDADGRPGALSRLAADRRAADARAGSRHLLRIAARRFRGAALSLRPRRARQDDPYRRLYWAFRLCAAQGAARARADRSALRAHRRIRGDVFRLLGAYRKWPTGDLRAVASVQGRAERQCFLDGFKREGVKRALRLSLCFGSGGEGLRRTGLVVVNPPFVFEEEARKILAFPAPLLAQGEGAGFVVEELTGE